MESCLVSFSRVPKQAFEPCRSADEVCHGRTGYETRQEELEELTVY